MLEKLKAEVARGNVSERWSDDGNFVVYNYTPECTYSGMWNDTTAQARGLVFDREGRMVARPFPKFFNYEELGARERELIHKGKPEVMAKVDGSLGIIFWDNYQHKLRVSTRGSLDSEQAIWASRQLESNDKFVPLRDAAQYLVEQGYTPLVEIIYPENRIVVDYEGVEALPMLGAVKLASGQVYCRAGVKSLLYPRYQVDLVAAVTDTDLQQLQIYRGETTHNIEGWVLVVDDPHSIGGKLMAKLKTDAYVTAHRLLFSLSPKRVIEGLAAEEPVSANEVFAAAASKELKEEIRASEIALLDMFHLEYEKIEALHTELPKGSRKEQALWLKEHVSPYQQALVFNRLDDKDIAPLIWRRIKEDVCTQKNS